MHDAIALSLLLLAACGAEAPCPVVAAPISAPAAPSPISSAASAPKPAPKIDEQDPVDRTRDALLAAFRAKDVARIDALFSANMRKALPPAELATFVDRVLAAKGALGQAKPMPDTPATPRHASYRLGAERGEWLLDLAVADDGTILGMKITDVPPPDPPVVRRNLPLALPFHDEWLVVWGGSTEDVNQHVRHKSQRRAADLFKVDADGKSHKGDGKNIGDYFAYGQPVLAAEAGKVITVVDGLPDSVPGVLNPYAAVGNVVIIEHAAIQGEPVVYSLYAHLKPYSTKVKPGAAVKRGQVLASCGNSGNSSEPHLHFQLMDGPRVESSFGVEPTFSSVTVARDGKTETRGNYTFLKGDRIRQAESPKGMLDTSL